MGLTYKDVKQQSLQVWGQFGESKWIPNANINVKLPFKDCRELENSKVGKFSLLIAMGASLEGHIDLIKKNRDKFEITTCDKGFGTLLEQGIKADYVVLCDASIPFKWLEPYVEQTKGVKLLSAAYANPEWTQAWKGDIYFFINKDAIETEKHFKDIFGPGIRVIPAGSNVSNAMVIFWTGCDEKSNSNWSGYERFFLVGYDYSWKGNYYAFNDPKPKKFYMHHRTMTDINGDRCFTSENLLFSSRWLTQYINTFNLPVVNCSGRGLLESNYKRDLKAELEGIHNTPEALNEILGQFERLKIANRELNEAKEGFNKSREALYGTR